MLRLTLFLCAAMIGALMLLGEDRGQLRPGLAKAAADGPAPLAAPEPAPAPVLAAAPPAPKPVAAAPAPAETAPYVEPLREVVQSVAEPVFTLSALGNESVPGENGAPLASEPAAETPANGIWYVNANSVNVRSAPSTEAEVLGRLTNGEAALMVAEVDGEWARIVIQGDGLEGYVALRYLTAEAP